ncbi:MAG: chemotaxis protein CheX [Pseudomonadales bacterium]
MNVKYINPLLESTINVLSTMAMVEATPGKPSIKNGSKPLGAITGMIDLSGKQVHGSLAISFSTLAILHITKKMLSETVDSIDDTVVDVVGEIINMITGSAKRIYSEEGMDFELTLPTVIVGTDKPINHSVQGNPILLPFTTEAGEFYLEFAFS